VLKINKIDGIFKLARLILFVIFVD